jgi:hypothetical protein
MAAEVREMSRRAEFAEYRKLQMQRESNEYVKDISFLSYSNNTEKFIYMINKEDIYSSAYRSFKRKIEYNIDDKKNMAIEKHNKLYYENNELIVTSITKKGGGCFFILFTAAVCIVATMCNNAFSEDSNKRELFGVVDIKGYMILISIVLISAAIYFSNQNDADEAKEKLKTKKEEIDKSIENINAINNEVIEKIEEVKKEFHDFFMVFVFEYPQLYVKDKELPSICSVNKNEIIDIYKNDNETKEAVLKKFDECWSYIKEAEFKKNRIEIKNA